MTFAVIETGNPFPGLRSFEREQAHLFFGRDEQIRDLMARLQGHRFLPIVGMSGSGKSSLVRAGLIPALTGSYVDADTSRWRIAVLRPGRHPMHELAAALCNLFAVRESESVLQTLRGSTAGLARVAQQHLRGKEKLLVLVDQFEELFRYREEADTGSETDDATAFVKVLLGAAGESDHPLPGFEKASVFVVTTMRSDFLGRCSCFRGLPEALNQTQYLIPRLTREQQRDVIEGPIGMAGASVEPALVQRLLKDLRDNPDQLPALQHALMRTWEQSAAARAEGKPITVADYEAVGTMAEALNRDADRVYEPLSRDESSSVITRRLFQRLVQPDGQTRSPTPLSELVAVTAAEEDDVKRVITVFEQRGFLTMSRDEDPIVDITHESLIRGWQQLTSWVQEETRSAAIYRRLADQAALYANDEASLLIDPQLQLTLNWRDETKPNEAWANRYDSRYLPAMQFLEQSRKEHSEALEQIELKRRSALMRARLTAAVLGTLLLLAIGASVFAAVQWKRTREERDRSNRLLYDSNIYFASSAVASGQPALARERMYELLDDSFKEFRGFEWFYLWRSIHAEEATLSGHSSSVFSVAFSPDGKTLASGGIDQTVKLWDVGARKEVATLSGHSDTVWSVAFSPDGKTLASASRGNGVKLWDLATHAEVGSLSVAGLIESVVFSPEGKTLVLAADKLVKVWDIATRTEVATLSGHSAAVSCVAFSPDGRILASAGEDNTVKLWNTVTHEEMATLAGHFSALTSVAFSPDGKTLGSASADNTVKLWDLAALKEVATLSGHSSVVLSMAFSPDGKIVASASSDNTVKLWDFASRKEVATLSSHSEPVSSIAFSPDGKILASVSFDNTVKLWDTVVRKEKGVLSGHSKTVLSLALSPDGKTVASAGEDNSVKLWDPASRTEVRTLSGHSSSVSSIAFSPDGRTLASASADDTVKLWDLVVGQELATFSGHAKDIRSVAFSPDGKILASASADETVRLWDIAARKEVGKISSDYGVWSMAFSPDGKTLAFATLFHVRLWDTIANKDLTTLTLEDLPFSISTLAFSPDGKTLAVGYDNTVSLWDIADRKKLGVLSGHFERVASLAFSPDGKTLASGSYDNTVKLWDLIGRKEVATLSGDSADVRAVVFSSDGKTLAAGSADGTVRLWFAATEQEVEERRPQRR